MTSRHDNENDVEGKDTLQEYVVLGKMVPRVHHVRLKALSEEHARQLVSTRMRTETEMFEITMVIPQ